MWDSAYSFIFSLNHKLCVSFSFFCKIIFNFVVNYACVRTYTFLKIVCWRSDKRPLS